VDAPPIDPPVQDDRSAALLIAAAIVAFPLLRPSGPGNFTPTDVLMGVAILGAIVWAGTYRVPLRLPYLVPMAILLLTDSSRRCSVRNRQGPLDTMQDVFLLAWAAAIANVIRVPGTSRSSSLVGVGSDRLGVAPDSRDGRRPVFARGG
jgi:hypothetical protein